MRIDIGGIDLCVVLRRGVGEGSVEVRPPVPATQGQDKGVVVGHPIVLGIKHLPEAGIQSRWNQAVVQDQVPR